MLLQLHELCDRLELRARELRDEVALGEQMAECALSKECVGRARAAVDDLEWLLTWQLRPLANKVKPRRKRGITA
jgi:hypothetical protein